MPKVIITGKSFKEKRSTVYVYTKKIFVYPTNHGNLTAQEIADLEKINVQTVRNKICRGLYSFENRKKRKPVKVEESVEIEKTGKESKINKISIGSWEQEQLMKKDKL